MIITLYPKLHMQFNKITPGQEEIIRHRAYRLQSKADRITAFRKKYAPYLGVAIGLTKPNWVTTAATAHMWEGDRRDGDNAKKAQREMAKITGKIEPLSNGHIEDPKADKVHFWSQLGGLFVRSMLQKDPKTTVVTVGVGLATLWRDKKMAETRQFVTNHKLDRPIHGAEELTISVAAINANRAKTAGQAISETVLVSPFSNNETVKNLALGGLVASTALGTYGMRQYKRQVIDTQAQREAYFAAQCPDELEYPLVQSSPPLSQEAVA